MWQFSELRPGQPERDPHETEFFKEDKAVDALVRESIQNSLDAKLPQSDNIRVRFTLFPIIGKKKDNYFKEIENHYAICKFPDESLKNTIGRPHFLLIEDFGTTGLDGKICREKPGEEIKSNYYSFWWQEGISEKDRVSAGRWGLGKTVFPMCSGLRAFWGFTIRNDDNRELLLGKSLLRCHLYDGRRYNYYGYFAGKGFEPIETENIINDFRNYFKITREREPGLSIIIPDIIPEINTDAITRAVIMNYFYPVISGKLIVEVNYNNEENCCVELNKNTLLKYASEQDWTDTKWEKRNVKSLMDFIENIATFPEERIFNLKGMPEQQESFGKDKNLGDIRKRYADNELLAFRIPVRISPAGRESVKSHFDVYVQKDESLDKADEFYIRSGITIPKIKNLGNRPVRTLLSAGDEYVSSFLGDSEPPAHEDWNERTEGFRGKYQDAGRILRQIKTSVWQIINVLDIPSQERDIDFFKDVFFVKEPVNGPGTVKPIPPIIKSPQIFNMSDIKAGFRITLSGENVKEKEFPFLAEVKIAYDVLRGNPFKKYNELDFNLDNKTFSEKINGGKILTSKLNTVKVEILNEDFEFTVTGFDENRDIIVDVKEVE
ncbi:MAG: hypothetical protein QME51_02150 [Planctomycetota bacterium]|nr:hypothetical protein [Planctomycetota bacterium]MDI6787155.1 hypothetical protein [Planctomycetota bacterium]